MANQPNLLYTPWGNLSVPWAEYTSRSSATSDIALGYGQGNQAVMNLLFYWDDFWANDVPAQILGYSVFNRGTGNVDRSMPLIHPWLPQCYASRIASIKGIKWLAKSSNVVTGVVVSTYQYALATVVFTMPNYVVMTDTQIDSIYGSPRQEWQRFLSFEFEAATEVIERPGAAAGTASFQYAEGTAGNFPNPINQYLNTATLLMTWRQVPRSGLFSNGGVGPPTNLLNAINTVNHNTGMFGYPYYVLRCDPPKFIEIQAPVPAQFLGLNPFSSPPICYDVQLRFAWRAMKPFANQWGHNAFPRAADPLWYLATTNGGLPTYNQPLTTTLFLSSDFTDLFKMNM